MIHELAFLVLIGMLCLWFGINRYEKRKNTAPEIKDWEKFFKDTAVGMDPKEIENGIKKGRW